MTAPTMDQKKGEVVYLTFNTNAADGSAVAPTVNGTVSVFADGSGTAVATDADAHVTYTVSFGTIVGFNVVAIDTSNALYVAETNYKVTVDGMTVDGVASVMTVVGNFNLRAVSLDDLFGSFFYDGVWRWDTNTAATDPGSGNVKVNNATYASVTEIYISEASINGLNAGLFFGNLKAGDHIVLGEEKDPAGTYIVASLSGVATDNGTWWTLPVTVLSSAGAVGNNQRTSVGFRYAPRPSEIDMAQTVPESYSTVSGTPTISQILHEINQTAADFGITGTALSVKNKAGAEAMSFTLDSATDPTSRTRTT